MSYFLVAEVHFYKSTQKSLERSGLFCCDKTRFNWWISIKV